MIIGTGYVGLTIGVGMAELGHEIICYDKNTEKIRSLNEYKLPIFEEGMEEMFEKNKNTISFTDNLFTSIQQVSILFLTIGTPSLENGSVDTTDLFQAVEQIGHLLAKPILIVNKCTAPPGTTDKIRKKLQKIIYERNLDFHCRIVFNPEFLHEGKALQDFFHPDRIIVGIDKPDEFPEFNEIFSFYITNNIPVLYTDTKTAELLKYVNNAVAAMKISFINEIANICEREHVNVWELVKLLTYDKRVSPQYLSPGIGFGGSCLPKDIRALEWMAQNVNVSLTMINKIIEANKNQIELTVSVIRTLFPKGQLTVLGTAFKGNTNDIRESPSIQVIKELLKAPDYTISLFDPQAMENTKKELSAISNSIIYFSDVYSACVGSGAIAILTNWESFSSLDLVKIKQSLSRAFIFDFHNVIGENQLKEHGFQYYIRGITTDKEDTNYD